MPHMTVTALYAIGAANGERQAAGSLDFELDGIVGDRHRGIQRRAYKSDRQPPGSLRRNERMWSAVSVEELQGISNTMDLEQGLTPSDLTANLCFEGFPELSKLPKGSLLRFPSGLLLVVEEFCEPCLEKGQELKSRFKTRSGKELGPGAFGKAASIRRGLVGVVEASGRADVGDQVEITIYSHPRHLALTTN